MRFNCMSEYIGSRLYSNVVLVSIADLLRILPCELTVNTDQLADVNVTADWWRT